MKFNGVAKDVTKWYECQVQTLGQNGTLQHANIGNKNYLAGIFHENWFRFYVAMNGHNEMYNKDDFLWCIVLQSMSLAQL